MMKTLVLICALGMPRADCSTTTAEAVIEGPEAASLVQCGLHGQAYIAHTAIAGYLDGEHYLKITCTSGRPLPAPPQPPVESASRPPGLAQATD